MRAPDIPTGWPSAMAPPFTFTTSSVMPRSRMDASPTAANASLSSNRSTSASGQVRLIERALDRTRRLGEQ